MRVLLSSVFGPYGVDDAFGRKENIMELFHNQVTREQGLFSLRFNHPSFGLYFLAENIHAPTAVLDFPSEKRFIKEIKKGYDYVGISFIVPNFIKARRMAELVREHAPESKILLGGHGTSIPGLESMIEHDHICRGEGVRWLRSLLKEDPDRPFKHPIMPTAFGRRVLGAPLKPDTGILIPGVGCSNACRFCCTSHFFDERASTIIAAKESGLEVCAGGILGLGESEEDRISLALTLAELAVDSVPLNILIPLPGTPVAGRASLPVAEILKAIALFRLILPTVPIRLAAGRETALEDFLAMAFWAGADGMMIGGYLTQRGRSPEKDQRTVREMLAIWSG